MEPMDCYSWYGLGDGSIGACAMTGGRCIGKRTCTDYHSRLPSAIDTLAAERGRLAAELAVSRKWSARWHMASRKWRELADSGEGADDQIANLGDVLMTVFGGPTCSESPCEMAARVLLAQRAELAAVKAELPLFRQVAAMLWQHGCGWERWALRLQSLEAKITSDNALAQAVKQRQEGDARLESVGWEVE